MAEEAGETPESAHAQDPPVHTTSQEQLQEQASREGSSEKYAPEVLDRQELDRPADTGSEDEFGDDDISIPDEGFIDPYEHDDVQDVTGIQETHEEPEAEEVIEGDTGDEESEEDEERIQISSPLITHPSSRLIDVRGSAAALDAVEQAFTTDILKILPTATSAFKSSFAALSLSLDTCLLTESENQKKGGKKATTRLNGRWSISQEHTRAQVTALKRCAAPASLEAFVKSDILVKPRNEDKLEHIVRQYLAQKRGLHPDQLEQLSDHVIMHELEQARFRYTADLVLDESGMNPSNTLTTL